MENNTAVLEMVGRLNNAWVRPEMLNEKEKAITVALMYDGMVYWSPSKMAYTLTDEGFRHWEGHLAA
jgi:hypothetical protein